MPKQTPGNTHTTGPTPGPAGAVAGHDSDSRTGVIAASLGLAAAVTLLIVLLRGESYWNFSDGVYAYTSRAVLHGGSLYSQIAAAQPPLVYLAGSGLLAISDTVMGLRLGLGLFQIATAVLASVAIYRITGSRIAALAGSLAALLAPRTLHDFANLLPETVGTPLVLGAAIAAARPKWCVLAGALGALAILTKLPFVFPVAALFWFATDRRRFFTGAAVTGLFLAGLFTLIYGSAFLQGTLFAQSGSGLADGSLLLRELGQAAWNLLPLLPLAVLGLGSRSRSADVPLVRLIAAGMFGSLAIFVTVIKHGAYINLAVAAEPFLVILAVCGTVWTIETATGHRFRLALVLACWALFLGQALSLIATPYEPEIFGQPFGKPDYGQIASSSAVREGAALLRTDPCDSSRAYYPSPFMAFAADIRMPGNQGDPFIIRVSDVYAKQRRLAAAEACR